MTKTLYLKDNEKESRQNTELLICFKLSYGAFTVRHLSQKQVLNPGQTGLHRLGQQALPQGRHLQIL